MSTLLKIDGLQASYGHAQALFGVSMAVDAGQVVTLLGRNGMGRSTTIKCLFGLLAAKAGNIVFGGQPLAQMASHQIARLGLGLVPEGRQIFTNLTVEENLVATARAPRAANQLEPWTLQRVYRLFPRLQERRSNLGWQLSGGEQQMLAIGRALMTNPRLLVLDEATEGLAPIIRTEIWNALAALKQEGLSQIVIDKNVGALLKLADRHYVMERGIVVWSGDSHKLRGEPEIIHQYLGV
ncbi:MULTISPECIES: ABC transporter ATP-binding protein [unclassified Duganella]|jgi:branched-chain amino acid transport system ATP-binding protein|uniref:ABC transporter ATP-binding protein n=1 Tax=unclassified Duganella TaxID=2636909 RepID=UPI000887E4ED|nr:MULTISPECIES: ABC transporter ATP-binding protein [unclassified Duganella]SDG59405.1 amino acid/amide ABC transporter ATP-binding protein 2, HAAT family (TC 3.A.1.4.-) [Duganella sp. OV458]SDJ82512.1 amino acid/amide ABC transporter ATP-binding protein 2, HAAT family [Duganella sp. OV510]